MSAASDDAGSRAATRSDDGQRSHDDLCLREEDRAARVVARTVFDRPIVLEAGAGTGKTTALVARIVAWLVDHGFDRARAALGSDSPPERVAARALDGILAITFTEAAAADMDAKIRAALAAIESGARPTGMEDHAFGTSADERALRARHLRVALERPIAQTIHSWCSTLLSEHPLEAGLHPRFQVDAKARIVAEVAREIVAQDIRRELGGDARSDWLLLAAREIGPADVEKALVGLTLDGGRAQDFGVESFPAPELARLDAELRGALSTFLDQCGPSIAPASGVVKGQTPKHESVYRSLSALRAAIDGPTDDAATLSARARAVGSTIQKTEMARLEDWARGIFLDGERKHFGDRVSVIRELASVLHPILVRHRRLDPELERAARVLLARLLGDLRERLVTRGVETFGDLLRDARDLLVSDATLRVRLQNRLDQVLVDEFQDTDPLQCEIVAAIALDPARGRVPGLLLVGDPKQSIYGWRRADLEAYETFIERVLATGGTRHRLALNFRSKPEILAHVQHVIEPAMSKEPSVQPAFQPLTAHRTEIGGVLETWIAWRLDETAKNRHDTSSADANRAECRFLAAELRLSRARGVDWKDMAVLMRTAGALDVLLEELRAADVPYHVAGDKSYYRRREIVDIACLVVAIVDPGDHLALLAYLRSPFVGLPDAALLPLWAEDFCARVSRIDGVDETAVIEARRAVKTATRNMPKDIPGLDRLAGFEHALAHALESLALLRASFATDPVDEFIDKLRVLTLAEATAAARFQGAFRLASLQRFFGEIQVELENSSGDVPALIRLLRNAIQDAPDTTDARPRDAAESSVSILTIHKSKGLDFGEVYVLGLHRKDNGRSVRKQAHSAWDRRGHVLFGAPTLGWLEVEERVKQRDAAERVRLLYVAMTRAKNKLVLSGKWSKKTSEAGAAELARALDVAGARALIDLVQPAVHAEAIVFVEGWKAGGPTDFVADGVRYRLPPNADDAQASTAIERDDPPPVEVATRDDAWLRAESDRIERRSKLSWIAAVSGVTKLRDEPLEDERPRPRPKPSIAALAGTAVHAVLERFRLDADFQIEAGVRRSELARHIEQGLEGQLDVDADTARGAIRLSESVFDAFVGGPLFVRLQSIAMHVIARELSILVRPKPDETAAGAFTGSIDLVYRDPLTNELVVVDYKTESVGDERDASEHALRHAPQLALYRRALQIALGLERLPRGEVWFLASSACVPG